MTPSPFLICLTLLVADGAAVAAPASGAATAPAAPASAACPARAASQGQPRITSKARHIPDERDPCADSRGAVAPRR